MAELGQLERAKRRRLQEAYGDLRPAQGAPDRQAKLRSLLMGAMADAGASGALGGSAAADSGGRATPEDTLALAAAAAANLAAVVSSEKRKPAVTGRRPAAAAAAAVIGSPGMTAAGAWTAPTGTGASAAAWASPAGASAGRGSLGAGGGGGGTPGGAAGRCAGAGGRGGGGSGGHGSGNPHRAPPPDPLAGGFIPDTDPITRLSQLPTAVAVLQRSGTPCGGLGAVSGMGGGKGGAGSGGLRIAVGLASRLAGGGGSANGARPGAVGGTAAALAAAAEAAAAARAAAEEDALLAEAELPSDIELALMSLRTDWRAHLPCAALPPLALRSQLAAAGLRDRGSVERQLDEQRQAGRVRLFRLPTGKDEFGILLTSDYRDIVRRAADDAVVAAAAAAAAAGATVAAAAGSAATRTGAAASWGAAKPGPGVLGHTNGGTGCGGPAVGTPASGGRAAVAADRSALLHQHHQALNGCDPAARLLSYGAYGSADDYDYETGGARQARAFGSGSAASGAGAGTSGGGSGSAACRVSKWHAAAEIFLTRVVERYFDFELSSEHLLRLLLSAPGPNAAAASTAAAREHQTVAAAGVGGGTATGPCTATEAEDMVSLLLHLGCLGRHTDGDADAYVLAVPGAGKVVKAVADGRRELLLWLSKRQHQEAPEKTICEMRLQRSCLPPLYHVRDLVGRGSARRIEAAVGPMIKLTPLGVAAAAAAAAAGKKPATGTRRRQHS
ncbi:hypothetical protein HYH02_011385 [Chlamydomonas schloesseri]|uniref:Uncharacterized protein n=1 Tax=Chlamydomonas schloesseri TaxID=2026947 RepID=A0A835W4T8_9CHLO|nr:hypothetical protein HYH02_011385 [Chlamydomonas schloesseri]|eukprot:KAG2437129.1 hypothetical protein HYH02_011385 [Chlamydomonas schloesseri]